MTANLSDEFFAHFSHRYQTATPCQGPWRLEPETGSDGVTLRVVADGETLFEVVAPIDGSDRAIDAAHDIGLAVAARNAGLLLRDEVLRLQKELAEAVAALGDLLQTSEQLSARLERHDPEFRAARLATRGAQPGGGG